MVWLGFKVIFCEFSSDIWVPKTKHMLKTFLDEKMLELVSVQGQFFSINFPQVPVFGTNFPEDLLLIAPAKYLCTAFKEVPWSPVPKSELSTSIYPRNNFIMFCVGDSFALLSLTLSDM